jgi:hypothetical protein
MTSMLRGTPVQYELKRVNRFIVEFPSELNIESWLVHSATRPSKSINRVPVPYMNTEFGVAGIYKWNAMDLEFIDPIGPSSSQKLMEWSRLHAESTTGRMGYAASYKKDLILYSLDPTGAPVEKWVLFQCQIVDLNFGNNAHGDDELQKIKLQVHPDWCEQEY